MRLTPSAPLWNLAAPLAIYLGVLLVRLALVGGPPHFDDGVYTFNAQVSSMGVRSWPLAPINLYPSLIGMVGVPPSTPFLRPRVADAFLAATAPVVCFFFLRRWAGAPVALVMATAWAIAVNLPAFAQWGYKNSIPIATSFYLGALWTLSTRARAAPFCAGLLVPWAIALREPFVSVPIVTLALAVMLHGRRGLLFHILGLAVSGCVLLAWLSLFRGSLVEMLGYYHDLAIFYRALPRLCRGFQEVDALRWSNLAVAVRQTMWILPLALAGLAWLALSGRRELVPKVLAVLLFVPPLFEIVGKVCIEYHWAQLLLGVAFLGAMGLQWLSGLGQSSSARWLPVAGYVVLAWLVGELDARNVAKSYYWAFHQSREFAPVMVFGRWDDASVKQSRLLEVAKYIRDHTTPDDRILVAFAGQGFYSLSDRLPPSLLASDLTLMTANDYTRTRPEVVETLRQHPPRLIVSMTHDPIPMEKFWPDFARRYRLAKSFTQDSSLDWGNVKFSIWELNDRAEPASKLPVQGG